MGKKTHGPYLIQAIEANNHERVHDICAKQVGNKEKVREMCVSQVRRLALESTEVPLLLAAQLPDPSILQYLVHKHGVDINFVVKEQWGRRVKVKTALIMGVRRGLYDAVEVMLSSNADPNVQDHKGRTPLHHAVRKADFRMAKMLLSRGAQSSLVDKGDNTPLHVAAIFGHVELCKMLIHYGSDLYRKGQLGAIPIHIAAKEGHVALLKLFCQQDVNPNIKMPCYDGREKAALHVACEEGHHECVQCLVDTLGADPNLGDSEGETPLNCCVLREYDPMGMKSKEDYTETVKVLIRHGAEVNLANGRGETALHLAARNEFHKIVELLLQAGIDPLIEDGNGDKAIDLVNVEDVATHSIIKQAMENRERYMNDVFEMKARGMSTSMDVLSSARSTSTLNTQDSFRMRSSSATGLSVLPPHHVTYEGYLQPLQRPNGMAHAQIHNDSRSSKSLSSGSPHDTVSQISAAQNRSRTPDQTYSRIDPDEMRQDPAFVREHRVSQSLNEKTKKSNFGLPKFLKKNKSKESLLARQASLKSTDSSQFDERSLYDPNKSPAPKASPAPQRVMEPIEPGTRKLPTPPASQVAAVAAAAPVRDSVISTDQSVMNMTARSSTSTFRPDSDFGVGKTQQELMQMLQQNFAARKLEYSDVNTTQYESLPGTGPPMMTQLAPPAAQPTAGTSPRSNRAPMATQDTQNGLSDSDDTYFDDASFDSVSEATVEMVQQHQQKIEQANKELYDEAGQRVAKGDPHVRNWLSEQATLVQQRNFKNASPLAQSTPPASKAPAAAHLFSDTDTDHFTSVSQQVAHKPGSKPKPATAKKPGKVDKNANAKPMPPPRPPKERTASSSSDSHRKPLPNEPAKGSKKPLVTSAKKPGVSLVEGESDLVEFEVDDKDPGQTVIRIRPVNKPKPSPQITRHMTTTSSPAAARTPAESTPKDGAKSGGRHGSYKAGMLDTESEVMSEASFATTSSFFKPIPKKRANIPKGSQLTRRESKRVTPGRQRPVVQSEESDIDSNYSDSDSEEDINTAHMTARFFTSHAAAAQSSDIQMSHVVMPTIEPSTPATPTIKMTMQMPEKPKSVPAEAPAKPEVHQKPMPKPAVKPEKHKVLPEPPPKNFLKPLPKPVLASKPPEVKESPPVPRKPVVASKPPPEVPKPKVQEAPAKPPQPAARQTAPKVIAIERPPNAVDDDAGAMSSDDNLSDDASDEEPLPPPVDTQPAKEPPKPKERKATKHAKPPAENAVEIVDMDAPPKSELPAEEKVKKTKAKKEKDKDKPKKKKKKVKAATTAADAHDSSAAEIQPPAVTGAGKSPLADMSTDTVPSVIAPTPSSTSTAKSSVTQSFIATQPDDDTYMQPVPSTGPTIPIEANPNPSAESDPALVTARQKRKLKRQKSKGNTVDSQPAETEEMKPIEPAVYSNSPPMRVKVEHTKKEGVNYAVPGKKNKKHTPPTFVKVEPGSDGSDEANMQQAPPLPAPLESPYAEISVVDDLKRSGQADDRTQDALDLDSSKRVTIGKKEFIPNNVKRPKDHDHRRIMFNSDGQMHFEIIGGNAQGIFAHKVRFGSPADQAGLTNGDMILKINGRSMKGKTREEATALANSIKRAMELTVRERKDIYRSVVDSGGVGDSFNVRAQFSYRAQHGELHIRPGDIFTVKDSLPGGMYGNWLATKLTALPREPTSGLIPNQRRAEQLALDTRMSQLKAFEKQKGGFMKKGFNRSKSLDRLKKGKSQEDLNLSAQGTIAYERIEQRTAPFPKPVLLLGLFCDSVRDLLAKERPDTFVAAKDVEIPQDPNSPPNDLPVKLDVIKDICYAQQKHCLTILSPPAIQYLQKTELNPIVVYLSPGSKSVLKIVKSRFGPNIDRKVDFLFGEAQTFEKQQAHMFTATVTYTQNDAWFHNLIELISSLQHQPQWYVVKDDANDDDDDDDVDEGEPLSPNMPQFPAPTPGRLQAPNPASSRLNRSMEAIPDSVEQMLNLHAGGRQPTARARAQSHGGFLGDNESFDSSGMSRGPKSILKNSSNNSDSGSASSASHTAAGGTAGARGRLPSRVPPTAISQQYQPLAATTPVQAPAQHSPHKAPSPYKQGQGHAKPAPYNQPFDEYDSRPAYTSPTMHPPAGAPPHAMTHAHEPLPQQQQHSAPPDGQLGANAAGFHPAFAQLGPSVFNKPVVNSSAKETSF